MASARLHRIDPEEYIGCVSMLVPLSGHHRHSIGANHEQRWDISD
jgi:hypothetical protein